MNKMRIQSRIMIALGLVLIIGIVLQCVVIAIFSSQSARALSNDIAKEATARYAGDFELLAAELYSTARAASMVLDDFSSDADGRERSISAMSKILYSHEMITGVWTAWEPNAYDGADSGHRNAEGHDASGRFVPYIYRDGAGGYGLMALPGYDDPVEGFYYQGCKTSQRTFITEPYETAMGNEWITVLTITVPIMDGDRFKGAFGIDFSLSGIAEEINSANIMEEGYLFLLSQQGIFVSHPDTSLIKTNYRDATMAAQSSDIERVLQQGEIRQVTGRDHKGSVIFTDVPVAFGDSPVRMMVGSAVPMSRVNATSNSLIMVVVIAGLLLLAASSYSTVGVLRRALRHMPGITHAAQLMAEGDIAALQFPADDDNGETKNEIILLGRSFVALAETTKAQVAAVQRIAEKDFSFDIYPKSDRDLLNVALKQVLDSNNEAFLSIRAAAGQVAIGSQQVSAGAQGLAQGSTEQAASVEELSASILNVLEQAKGNAQNAGQTLDLVTESGSRMEQSVTFMTQLQDAMSSISESSSDISKIIKTIDDIAFQTNILALNAAVEAARAGQYGKGFAVVADEVRTLASRSAEAAQETAGLIQESIEHVKRGSEITRKTGESLRSVAEAAHRSQESIEGISAASRDQQMAIEQINIGIEQISMVVQANSATSEQSAAVSEEMSSQAELLSQTIANFKLRGQDSSAGFHSETSSPY